MFSRIIKTIIHRCRYNWSNHVKTSVHLYVDFFIYVFFNSYSHASNLVTYNKYCNENDVNFCRILVVRLITHYSKILKL